MRILFVVNPIAGGKSKDTFLQYLDEYALKYGLDYYLFKTSGEEDAAPFQKKLDEYQPERVCAIGGDGTVLFVARQLIGSEIPMGIIPFGSANGMATELGIDEDPRVALDDFVKSRKIAGLDMIEVNKEYCLHIGDVGINARVVEDFSKDSNRGMFTYAKYLFQALQNADQFSFEIETESSNYKDSGYMLAIANARKYGNGAILNNKGNPFDGKLELVIGHRKDLESIIYLGLTKFSEEVSMDEYTEIIQCEKAKIKLDKPQLLQLDGEVIGKTDELNIRIMPGAIRLVTHGENPFID
jgi:diacylglycerol kinase (ATP)